MIAQTLHAEADIRCAHCQACCCRLEVILISDTGVPEHYIDINSWQARVMARLDDGWCAALDRDTFLCKIYENRPSICRDFEMGGHECITERKNNL
jgi:Fe-S-cluster containining protein